MSETTRPTSNPAQPFPDYLGAFVTIHEEQYKKRFDASWADPLCTYYKYLETQFVVKEIYDSGSECFGCGREDSEYTYLVENSLAFNLLQCENGKHHWKVFTRSTDEVYEFNVHIEVVPLIPTKDEFWRNNRDIKFEKFTTYGAGGSSVIKSPFGVCLTHLPTGISARVTRTRALIDSIMYAEKLLASRLFAHEQGTLNNTKLVRTVDLTNSTIRNERTGFVSTDIESFMEGNIHHSL